VMGSISRSNVVIENAMVVDFQANVGLRAFKRSVSSRSYSQKRWFSGTGLNCSRTKNAPA